MIDHESEAAVLGSILIENKCLATASTVLDVSDFELASNALIYETMLRMANTATPIDLITLSAELENYNMLNRIGGRARVVELCEVVPTAANVEHYAEAVRTNAIRRRLKEAGSKINSLASKNDVATAVEEAQRQLLAVAKRAAPNKKVKLSDAMGEAYRHVEEVHSRGSKITGISTGFRALDEMMAGLHPRELVILAARPGMGKTALATNLA